ncbi:acyl-CoA dehydrogenase family protein [Parasphingorhabdus sp. JC815]|uniref:acyl-CoA dehydrogenase family protein n=1 Tax=Parasphingorhabdus sp. JC815 TaxID=3232140 RepID=UPI003458ADB7
MSDLESFRAETAEWLEANCPPEMREPVTDESDMCWGGKNATYKPGQKEWMDIMAAKGWTVPDWPKEYGGGGLSREETKILLQEMGRLKIRSPLASFGIWMLGPALLHFGTEEQKLHFLPPIARGEVRWCQGYSEPGSGSDLASLQTSAEDKGDHYLINGQKIWTSYADKADWIFCLTRTDKSSKHKGISFMLFDMTSKGVETKPIVLISGQSAFCETFFTDVEVPKTYGEGISSVVGEVNRGWDVAKYLLGHERSMISSDGSAGATSLGAKFADTYGRDEKGRLDDPMLRSQMAEMDIDVLAFRAMAERFGDTFKANLCHPAQPNMMKYAGTEINKRRHELIMSAGGSEVLEWESDATNGGLTARSWLRTKANSIEGGTSEVMLNVIAKQILQLPNA